MLSLIWVQTAWHPGGIEKNQASDTIIKCEGIIKALIPHPGSGSDRTIASEWKNTALAKLYIGGSVTCNQKKTQGA